MPYFKNADDRLFWFDEAPDELPEGFVAVTDEQAAAMEAPTIENARAALWNRVKAIRDSLTDAPGSSCTTPFGVVQVDQKSKLNINGLVTMAMVAQGAGAPFQTDFTLADNSVVTLDGAEMIGLGVAVGMHVAAAYARSRALRSEIEAVEDAEALAAIDVEAGWP